jgi:hypothetical protein
MVCRVDIGKAAFRPDRDGSAHHRTGCAFRSMRIPLKEHLMMDVIMLAIGLVFFALSVGYVVACDRL